MKKREKNPKRISTAVWILCAAQILIAVLMYFVLPHFPWFTEHFITRGVFRSFAFPAEFVMSVLPFSLTEICVVFGVPGIIVLVVIWIVHIVKNQNKKSTVEKGIRFAVWAVTLAAMIFMIMDGANFSRMPLADLMELPDSKYDKEQLYTVTADLAKKASEARENVSEDKNGCMVLSESLRKTLLDGNDCYKNIKKEYPFLVCATWRVKPVALSHLWSYTGYTGVYCPWLGESSVNIDVPPCEIGHTVTHELGHAMGFARENECNFLGYLACVTSGQSDYVYSGYLEAFTCCANALYGYDKSLGKKAYANCSEGVIRDMVAENKYWKSFQGKVMESSQEFNDAFIKSNGDKNGVLSYDKMVELILRYYDKQGLI